MDSTEDYDDVGHSEEADEILEKLLIGVVGESSDGAPPSKAVEAAKTVAPPVAAAAPPAKAVQAASAPPAARKASQKQPESDNTLMYVAGAAAVA